MTTKQFLNSILEQLAETFHDYKVYDDPLDKSVIVNGGEVYIDDYCDGEFNVAVWDKKNNTEHPLLEAYLSEKLLEAVDWDRIDNELYEIEKEERNWEETKRSICELNGWSY